jgi:hypothetical protein
MFLAMPFHVGKSILHHESLLEGEMLTGKKDQPPQHFLHGFALIPFGNPVGDLVDPLDNFPVLAVNQGNANAVEAFVPGQMVFVHGRSIMALYDKRKQGDGHISFLSKCPTAN